MATAVPDARRELLPLLDEEWEWKSFERFCLGYVLLQPDVVDAYLYGKRGEPQKGIDIVATLADGGTRTYQCRRYKRFSLKQAKATVAEDFFGADEHVLLLACDAPAGVRDYIDQESGWSLADVEDISSGVRRTLPRQQARELVEDSFGSQLRRAFVGPEGPLAFFSPARYFEPYLREGRLLHHRTTLVGRDDEVTSLRQVLLRPETRIVIIPGAGGSGKTRLVREITSELTGDLTVLIAAEAVELTPELVDDLPVEPLRVVVDDAHSRGDLTPLLAHARRAQADMKIVLVTRPQGVEQLAAQCRKVGFDGTEIVRLPSLRPLGDDLLRSLARQLLGDEDVRAGELARVADASPLLCVVGAGLLVRQEIRPDSLRTSGVFREEVLGRFSDELLGQVSAAHDPAFIRRLLEVLAAVGPVSVQDEGLLQVLGDLLGCDSAELRRAIGELETVGLLEARGRLRRVAPDVLADRLLTRAALGPDGQPTGWVEALYSVLGDRQLERLLTNVAVVDWQVTGGPGKLLDAVWHRLEARFDASRAFEREQLLKALEPIAGLQPRQALALARHAIASQTPTEQYSPVLDFATGQADIDRASVGLLAGVAQHSELLQEVMPLLWQLGRSDARALTDAGHPLKTLMDVGSYTRPSGHAEALLEFVERLVRLRGDEDAATPAIALLRPLLAREVERLSAVAPWQISTGSSRVLADRSSPLRRRAHDLLSDRARNGQLVEKLLAVEMLIDAMRHPFGLFGRRVSDEELDAWASDQLELITTCERIFEEVDDPLVRNRIRRGLDWHATHSRWPDVAERSRVLLEVELSLDERLLAEMVEGRMFGETMEFMLERRRALAEETATELPDGRRLARRLHQLLATAEAGGLRMTGTALVGELADAHPELCAAAADWILERDTTPLNASLAALLIGLRKIDRTGAAARAIALLKSGPTRRRCAASYATGFGPLSDPAPEESDLLDQVLADDDTTVREIGAIGLTRLAHEDVDSERTKRLLLNFDPHGDGPSAEHLASAVSDFGIDRLSEPELAVVLERYDSIPRLDYHAQQFLEQVGERRPDVSLEVVLRRLRLASQDREALLRYEAIPDRQLGPKLLAGAGSAGKYRELVRRLRDEYPALTGSARFMLASGLWDVVGEPWVAFDALAEWLLGSDTERQDAALELLGELHWPQLFALALPIALLLEQLTVRSANLAQRLTDRLRIVAQAGSWQRTPGHAASRHIETRDSALELAQRLSQWPAARRLYLLIAGDATTGMVDDAERDDEERMLYGL